MFVCDIDESEKSLAKKVTETGTELHPSLVKVTDAVSPLLNTNASGMPAQRLGKML